MGSLRFNLDFFLSKFYEFKKKIWEGQSLDMDIVSDSLTYDTYLVGKTV